MAVERTIVAQRTFDQVEGVAPEGPSGLTRALRKLLHRPPAIFGLVCVAIVVIWAATPGLFAPLDPLDQSLERYLKPPGYEDAQGRTYWLGTDRQGRDILSRIIWGSRISLIVGIATVLVSGLVGVTLGLLAGFFGGKLDAVISRIVDTALAIPFILLAMALIAILGASLQNIVLAIALRTWIVYARVVRGEVLALKEHDFVMGARAMGCGTLRILVIYLLPNVLSSAIVVATLYLGRMIIIEASLSFLGVGVPPPTPTWGGMLSDGRAFLDTAWWIAFFPGVVLMLTVLGVNLLGDWLRDVLDPRMKRLAE
ncbi:MAG TPA: ABC transporter permease [Methylomirabilota bacterium]|jgi:peptide/nickel transport system permease protein